MQQSGMVGRENRRLNVKTFITALVGQQKNPRVISAALVTATALAGWAMSAMFTVKATAFEGSSGSGITRENDAHKPLVDASKAGLIGSYKVTGTDSDGTAYAGASILDISLAPSGALELQWDNGKQVGVGQIIGHVLAVACLTKGRTAILMMNINPDGSLSGKRSRRTDRGSKGTESWKKV
jgi:hypothetical protein